MILITMMMMMMEEGDDDKAMTGLVMESKANNLVLYKIGSLQAWLRFFGQVIC